MDKRHFHRVGHDARATLRDGERLISCKVFDISLKGCLMELPHGAHSLALDGDYEIHIHLSDAVEIDMAVSLTHREGTRAGFVCRYIDLDSACALRRLVELNLGDPDLLERDLEALAHGGE